MSPYGEEVFVRSYDELKNPPAIAPHPLAGIAELARQSFCAGYRWNSRNNPISPEQLGLPNLLQPLVDMICDLPGDPPSLPPLPIDSKNQGQCKCGVYSVTYQNVFQNGGSQPASTFGAFGPVRLFRSDRTEANIQPGDFVISYHGDFPGQCTQNPIYFVALRNGIGSDRTNILSISPISGQSVGTCDRALLPEYQEPVTTPPSLPPIELPRLPPLPPLSVPVFLTPVLVRPEINFSPTINIDVGGVNLTFSFDGWEFSFNLGGQGDIILPPNQSPSLPPLPPVPPIYLPTPVNPPPSGGGGRDCCDEILEAISGLRGRVITLKEVVDLIKEKVDATDIYLRGPLKNLLDDIRECSCPPEIEVATSWSDLQDFSFNASGQELLFAIVGLTTPPIAGKTYKTPNGIRVAHSGWFAFGRNNVWGDRDPFDYVSKLCIAPDREMDSFTISAYTNMRHSGTLFRRKN